MKTSGAFFDGFANTFDTFYDGQRRPFVQWVDAHFRSDMFLRYRMTFDALGDLRGRTVIDIGCGSGPYVAESLKRGADRVIGIDPAPRMLQLARDRVTKLGLPGAAFLAGYFPDVVPAGRFDDAIVMGVLDYIRDPVPFLRVLHGLIDRRAVLSFPSTHWFRTPFRLVRYSLRRCPVYFYTKDRIAALMREAGITRYRIEKIPGAGMDFIVVIDR